MYKPGYRFEGEQGADHKNFDGTNIHPDGSDTGNWEACADLCGETDGCRGWTFVYNGKCYIKSSVDQLMQDWREDPNTISGFPRALSSSEHICVAMRRLPGMHV